MYSVLPAAPSNKSPLILEENTIATLYFPSSNFCESTVLPGSVIKGKLNSVHCSVSLAFEIRAIEIRLGLVNTFVPSRDFTLSSVS